MSDLSLYQALLYTQWMINVLNNDGLISGIKRINSQSSWKPAKSVQKNKEGRLGWMISINQTRSAIALNLQFIIHLNEKSVNNAIDVCI